jgi:prepilin-type processing-associated H-X9-DG protein
LVHQAQGIALGRRGTKIALSAQRANNSPRKTFGPLGRPTNKWGLLPQGDALGWVNNRAFGPDGNAKNNCYAPGSKDGRVIGGPATLFTTGAMMKSDGKTVVCTDLPSEGRLMNNGFFGSPGSEHPGGANYGMADASVRFLSTSIDPTVFALLGSMADGEKVAPPD